MYRFTELVGDKSAMRIMGFLIQNSPNNYNKSQLIAELQMGRKTLYDAWELLDKYHLVATISSDGKSRFYVLNKENKITVLLIKLFAAIEAN
jgi:Fe2+ or Zn2+ uptake regulation protein